MHLLRLHPFRNNLQKSYITRSAAASEATPGQRDLEVATVIAVHVAVQDAVGELHLPGSAEGGAAGDQRERLVVCQQRAGIDRRQVDLVQFGFLEVADDIAAGAFHRFADGVEVEDVLAGSAGQVSLPVPPLRMFVAGTPIRVSMPLPPSRMLACRVAGQGVVERVAGAVDRRRAVRMSFSRLAPRVRVTADCTVSISGRQGAGFGVMSPVALTT